jgi:dTDP-4-dehydrorhamnose reductase
VYGESKLAGEQAIQSVDGDYLIFRTAWVYSLRRENFVSKVLGWARKNEVLRVVDDQVSNPTWARMLAEVTAQVLARGPGYLREHTGLYHLAGDGYASRYAWARAILRLDPAKQEQKVKQMLPARSSDFPTPAQRPLFSALECQKFKQTFDLCLPVWEKALELALM